MKILLIFAFFAHVPFQAKANTYLNPANLTSLSDRFGYLKNSFGDNNDDVPEVISGPTREEPLVEYNCVESVNFIPDTTRGEAVCGSISDVLKICKDMCSEIGCTGFFYQEHSNNAGCSSSPQGGYQICGFTTAKDFTTVYHGHRKGSQVCSLMPACFDDESFKHKNKSNGTCKKFLENKKKRKRRCGSWDKRTGR